MSAVVEALRARIREIEGGRILRQRDPIGIAAVDGLIGGLPVPGLVEIHGPAGSGRARVALAIAGALTRRGWPVAWVDPERLLYPPAAGALGVDLDRLLLVRPPADRVSWTIEQLAGSGCFPLVVVGDGVLGERAGHRWDRASERGRCTVLALSDRPRRGVPSTIRLAVAEGQMVVVRDRGGAQGRRGPLPSLPASVDPWS